MHSISDMWYWLNAIVAGGFIRFFSFLGIGYLTFHLYECAEKMFKISDKLSAVALLSGEARFGGEDIKNFITKYLSKTDIDKINSTLNRCNSKSSSKRDVNDYIKKTFPYFESIIKNLNQNSLMDFLKNHSLKDSIDVLENNQVLNNMVLKLINSSFHIRDKSKFMELKFYIKQSYYDYLVKSSPTIAIVGYDEEFENPTFVKYNILFNTGDNLFLNLLETIPLIMKLYKKGVFLKFKTVILCLKKTIIES